MARAHEISRYILQWEMTQDNNYYSRQMDARRMLARQQHMNRMNDWVWIVRTRNDLTQVTTRPRK